MQLLIPSATICPSNAITVPNGYSPLLTAIRDSSMQRAIIASSVASHDISNIALPRFSRLIEPRTGWSPSQTYRRMAFGLVVSVIAGFTAAAVPNSHPVPRILFCLGSDEMKKKGQISVRGVRRLLSIALLALCTLTNCPPVSSFGSDLRTDYVRAQLRGVRRDKAVRRMFSQREARGHHEKIGSDRRSRRVGDCSSVRIMDLHPARARHDRLGQHPVPPVRAERQNRCRRLCRPEGRGGRPPP